MKPLASLYEIIIKEDIDIEVAHKLYTHYLKLDLEKNILEWGRYFFPDKFFKPFCFSFHDYLIEIMDEELTATLAPREHAKTVIKCFLVPLYLALTSNKYKHFLNVQNTVSKAININLSIRQELETNEKLRYLYGDQIDQTKWTEKQFCLKNGVVFSAIGCGESIRGMAWQNKRPDYIVLDDIYDDEDINNLGRCKKKSNWFWSTIYPARSSHKKCSIHIQGTAINKSDLMHTLKENAKFKKFQAVLDWDKKKTLWFPFEKLKKDKELMGTVIFSREMQNELRDDETSIIKSDWVRYYKAIPTDETIEHKILAVDPAIGLKNTNDYTGKCIIYKTNLGNWYIHHIWNDRKSFNDNIVHIKSLADEYELTTIRIEAIAAFKGLVQELRRTTDLPIVEIKSVTDKISRKEGQSAKFENGKVFINEAIPDGIRNELIEQLTINEPNHDDMSDAVVLALEMKTLDPSLVMKWI